jgi:mono/diheme cytochrome c family protein
MTGKEKEMIRKFSLLFSLLALLAFILVACGPEEPVETPPVEAPPENDIPVTGVHELMEIGEQVYADQCAACHMEDGTGDNDLYPPLDANAFVTGDPRPVIEIVLHGGGAMPPFDDLLTDEEIAGVVTYIRNAWTNDAPPVNEQDVQAAR